MSSRRLQYIFIKTNVCWVTMSGKSFSKGIISGQGGGHFLDLKPKVSLISLSHFCWFKLCHFTRAAKNLLWLAERKWKQSYYNHKKSFNHSHSSYVWHLKETLDVTPNLKQSVVRCSTPYSSISKKALLCLYEKLVVTAYPRQHELLNKRSELFCKYRHESKQL